MTKYKEIQTLLHEMYEQGKFDAIAELQTKGKAIVSKQIWDEHIVNWETNVKILEQARKNTAKEFAEKLKQTLIINNEENTEFFDYQETLETIDEIAKQYGVEVDE